MSKAMTIIALQQVVKEFGCQVEVTGGCNVVADCEGTTDDEAITQRDSRLELIKGSLSN